MVIYLQTDTINYKMDSVIEGVKISNAAMNSNSHFYKVSDIPELGVVILVCSCGINHIIDVTKYNQSYNE